MTKLDEILKKYDIKNENRLFLTIKNEYLDEMREGIKNVEYRDDTEFFRRKLFVKGEDGKPSRMMKPLKYVLFQGGYEPDSPRMLLELKGWTIGKETYPKDLDCRGHDIDSYMICLLLGRIIYDSQEGQLYRDLNPRKSRPTATAKPKAKKNLENLMKIRRHLKKTGKK